MLKRLLQGGLIATALAVSLLVPVKLAAAQNSVEIKVPVSTIVRGEVGSLHLLATKTLSTELQGLKCNVSTKAENQGSVHPNNDLIVKSGASQVVLSNVERAAGVITTANGELVTGDKITVTLKLGKDKVFSAGIEVKMICAPKVEMCEIEDKTHLPKNDPNCKEDEVEKCEIAGKEHLPKDDPGCKQEPQVLPETTLPVTGPGLGILALPGVVAFVGYLFMTKRQKA